MEKIVYIVHCIDTEGPLYESLEATFERIKNTFGFELESSNKNIEELRKKKINLFGKEEAVANFLDEDLLNNKSNWEEIRIMLDEITSKKFRDDLKDSFGNGWIYNWFCMDHVGFTGDNPRKRDMGFHKIFDYYIKYLKKQGNEKDLIQWHFHPISIKKDAHRCGVNYFNSPILTEILARKIIDRKWFPSVFRPGFHTERPDSNWFLEQWIPFDYANQSIKGGDTNQSDLAKGLFGDWRKAPVEWKVYHPSYEDYQKEGNCRRWIARCLNMKARLRELNEEDVRDAFKRAQLKKPTLLSFTNHDFRDMKKEINHVRDMIKKVSGEFPNIKFKFCNAIEAFRKVIGIQETKNPKFKIDFKRSEKGKIERIEIRCKKSIFGPQPFFALKTKKGEYLWQNLDFFGKNQWAFTFDFNTIDFDECEKIGIAANSLDGTTEVVLINPPILTVEKKIYRYQN